jgi:hypothetical protein
MSNFPTKAEVRAEIDSIITNAAAPGVITPLLHGALLGGTGGSAGKGILDYADVKAVASPITGGYESGWTTSGVIDHRIDNAGRCFVFGKITKGGTAGTTVHASFPSPPATTQTFAVVAISGGTAYQMAIQITAAGVLSVIGPPAITTYFIDLNLVYKV